MCACVARCLRTRMPAHLCGCAKIWRLHCNEPRSPKYYAPRSDHKTHWYSVVSTYMFGQSLQPDLSKNGLADSEKAAVAKAVARNRWCHGKPVCQAGRQAGPRSKGPRLRSYIDMYICVYIYIYIYIYICIEKVGERGMGDGSGIMSGMYNHTKRSEDTYYKRGMAN